MSASPAAGGDKKNIVKMAYIYFQEGRWDKAIEEYKKLIAMDPEDINTLNMLGDVYVKKGSVREAFESYDKVSTDFSARGQIDKAAIVNKKIAALDANLLSPEAQKKQNLIKQTLKAETAMEAGDMDGAIAALNEVLRLDAENLGAFSKLAELFEKKGQTSEAVKQYQMLGGTFLKNRLYKKAQEMFQKVVQLDPGNVEAHSSLAQIYVKQGSESDAKKEFLSAAEHALSGGDLDKADTFAAKAVEYKSIEAHYVLGMVLFKKQKLSDAKAEFESLLRFKVNHVGALVHLGRVLLDLGQADKAAESIQKALKGEKDNPAALEAWAEVCVKKGNKTEANATFLSLADKSAAKGEFGKAAEFARNAISLDENAEPPLSKLADVLRQAGEKTAAAEAFFKLGLLHEKQNRPEQAAEAFKKAFEMDPAHPEAQKKVQGSVAPPPAAPAPSKPAEVPPSAAPAPGRTTPPAGVLDLEQDVAAPPFGGKAPAPAAVPSAPEPPPPAAEKPKSAPEEPNPEEELKAQITIADNYVKQGLVEEAIEIYQQLIEAHPGKAELKQKLNQAYTAYVKTGEDVIGALEAEKKAKEEEERHLRAEMEKKAQEETQRLRMEMEEKARQEAEKRVRQEMEKKAREEAEAKAREEAEKRAKEEAERKAVAEREKLAKEELEKRLRDEMERKSKEEAERKAREEAERKSKEEADRKAREEEAAERKIREEMERKAKESARKPASADFPTSRTPPPSKGDSVEEGRDDFMTIAVADIYVRQGLHEEALKIYRRIVQLEPDNLEARKKASDLESLIKSKGGKVSPEASATPPPAKTPPPSPPHPPDEKDSGGKKKSNRVGYV